MEKEKGKNALEEEEKENLSRGGRAFFILSTATVHMVMFKESLKK